MAALTSMDQAQILAQQRIDNQTWRNAYSAKRADGVIVIKFERWLNFTGDNQPLTDVPQGTFDKMNTVGAWDETTDDSVT